MGAVAPNPSNLTSPSWGTATNETMSRRLADFGCIAGFAFTPWSQSNAMAVYMFKIFRDKRSGTPKVCRPLLS